MIKAVLFDLDGTLLNTVHDLRQSLNYVLAEHDLPIRSTEEVKSFVGNGTRMLVERGLPNGASDELLNACYKEFGDYYNKHLYDSSMPYDGIIGLLSALTVQNVETAVISNKPNASTVKLVEHFFPGIFTYVTGHKEGVPRKPEPDVVLSVLKLLNVKPEETVYVGDSETDIRTGENAGITCVSVSWGFRTKEELIAHGAKIIISKPSELMNYI